jgi:hypothetical protein
MPSHRRQALNTLASKIYNTTPPPTHPSHQHTTQYLPQQHPSASPSPSTPSFSHYTSIHATPLSPLASISSVFSMYSFLPIPALGQACHTLFLLNVTLTHSDTSRCSYRRFSSLGYELAFSCSHSCANMQRLREPLSLAVEVGLVYFLGCSLYVYGIMHGSSNPPHIRRISPIGSLGLINF